MIRCKATFVNINYFTLEGTEIQFHIAVTEKILHFYQVFLALCGKIQFTYILDHAINRGIEKTIRYYLAYQSNCSSQTFIKLIFRTSNFQTKKFFWHNSYLIRIWW